MIEVTEADFGRVVLKCDLAVLVEFTAPWCAACRALAPSLASLERKHAGQFGFASVNVAHSPALATRYHVESLPTLLLFSRGAVCRQIAPNRCAIAETLAEWRA